jgi:hypothetical protein
MSSALAMVLMAAMAVPGNGPENVSREVEQRLDLSGEWEGIYTTDKEQTLRVHLNRYRVRLENDDCDFAFDNSMVDEGRGRLRFQGLLGIYQQDEERLIICLGRIGTHERPTSFRIGNGQSLLILHRVKPRK